jgi:hypothetical protein
MKEASEALKIIEEMISKTKNDISEKGTYYLLWGWMVFAAAIGHFLLEIFPIGILPPITWPVFMGTAGLISYFISKKESKKVKVKSYLEDFMNTLWKAFGISLFIALFITLNKDPLLCYPVVLIFYGLGTFTTGVLLKFKPLILGSIGCWILSIVSIYVTFNIQLLLLATGVMVSYIIPGHLLKAQHNKIV